MNLESSILQSIRLASAPSVLWRNQCGAYIKDDYFIRYGIANPGGSDLIGITPIRILPQHLGRIIGVFTAAEVKTDTGKPTAAQLNFIDAVIRLGGIAGVVRSPRQFKALIRDF